MRKLVLVLLVAVLSVPAFAAPALTLVAGGTPGQVVVGYTADAGDLISGMGITLSVDNGAKITAFTNGASKYWVHPDNVIITGGVLTDKGSPIVGGPGVLPTASIVVEYGALYTRSNPSDPNKPLAIDALCTITVDKNCTLTATANHAGGVITEALVASAPSKTLAVTVAAPECMKASHPDYTRWVSYNKPDCWCYAKQCRGDADGKLTLTKPVMSPDLTIYKAGFNQSAAYVKANVSGTTPLICADFDHKDTLTKPVMSPDLTIYKEYFNDAAGTVPTCDATHINFWVTPL